MIMRSAVSVCLSVSLLYAMFDEKRRTFVELHVWGEFIVI